MKEETVVDEPQNTKDNETQDRKDSSMALSSDIQLPSIPIPFVVVEKVADKEQPEYGDTEPHPLAPDLAKRTADFEPDFEVTCEEEQSDTGPPKAPEVPLLVVEKTDDRLEHGVDFGDDATSGQKLAHDKRAADASPDNLIVTPEVHVKTGADEEQSAPLFRHESFQEEHTPSISAMDAIDEVSVQSSADQTSSEDNINTPGESQDEDMSSPEPLLPHEIKAEKPYTELGSGPLLPHESVLEEEEDEGDELSNAPLLSHEAGLTGDVEHSDGDEDDIDELDAAPLLPHETGFLQYKDSEIATKSDFLDDDVSEPRHYSNNNDNEGYRGNAIEPDEVPTFTHEDFDDEDNGHGDDDTPLLPHERDIAIQDDASPEEGGQFSLYGQPTFGYETDNAKDLFVGSGRPNIFRTRNNSSTLPHKLPPSDADDENLDDPSLERFPTNREQIFQRVQTIGVHLPEDQPMDDDLHSPAMSILSQACSSVDLAPVKSYTSLASVPEADDSDEEEMDDGDIESLPSPMVLNLSSAAKDFARDPHVTPMPVENKRVGWKEDEAADKSASHTTRSSEADSVGKNDGAKDFRLSNLQEAIATPANVFNTITPPLTPEKHDIVTKNDKAAPALEIELRHRNVPKQDASGDTSVPGASQDENDRAVKSSTPQQAGQPTESFLLSFFRVVFGSVGRFLAACIGDRKRAG